MSIRRVLLPCAFALLLAACGSDDDGEPVADARPADARRADADPDDAGNPDGPRADAAFADAALADAALADAAFADAALADAALADAAVPDAAAPDATLPDAAPPDATLPDPSTEIAAIRDAIRTAPASPVALGNRQVHGAIVTYVKPGIGGAGVGEAEGPGFFIQNQDTGPALFVAVDPGTFVPGGVAVGDVLDLSGSEGRWLSCGTCTADSSMYVVTAATGTRTATGAALPLPQDLSAVDLTLPIGPAPWPYEHERVSATFTLAGPFVGSGPGFLAAPITTLGEPTSSPDLVFRIPAQLAGEKGLASSCVITVIGTPAWRFAGKVELSAWASSDLTVQCPGLAVTASSPQDGATGVEPLTTLSLTFNLPLAPQGLAAQTSAGPCTGSLQVSADDFQSCIGFASAQPTLSAGSTVATVSPQPALSYGQTYKLRAKAGISAASGSTLAADHTVAFTTGSPGPSCAGSVVVSQVYGGGGNTSAPFKNDFVELHNRGSQAVVAAGWSVQYASAGGTSWSVTPLGALTIPAGGYVLVQGAGGNTGAPLPTADVVGMINLSGTAGKVALVTSTTALTGACPTGPAIVDFVGYGASASCAEGTPAPAPSNTTAILRSGAGCGDSGANAADFAAAAPTPKNAAAENALVCACGGPLSLNESNAAAEADFCNVQFPTSITIATGQTTEIIYGRLFEAGVTEAAGPPPGWSAQVGYGPVTANPTTQPGWTWFPATYNVQTGNDDEFSGSFTAPAPGSYFYAIRFSADGGLSWTTCDTLGAGQSPGLSFDVTQLPPLTVTP